MEDFDPAEVQPHRRIIPRESVERARAAGDQRPAPRGANLSGQVLGHRPGIRGVAQKRQRLAGRVLACKQREVGLGRLENLQQRLGDPRLAIGRVAAGIVEDLGPLAEQVRPLERLESLAGREPERVAGLDELLLDPPDLLGRLALGHDVGPRRHNRGRRPAAGLAPGLAQPAQAAAVERVDQVRAVIGVALENLEQDQPFAPRRVRLLAARNPQGADVAAHEAETAGLDGCGVVGNQHRLILRRPLAGWRASAPAPAGSHKFNETSQIPSCRGS